MSNFFSRNKSYIKIIILFLIIVIGSTYSVVYFMKKINTTFVQTQQLVAEQENRINMLTELPRIRDQYEEVSFQLSELDKFFESESIVDLAQELERIAAETGNEIVIEVDERPRPKVKKNGKKEEALIAFPEDQIIRMIVRLTGEYENVIGFVQKAKTVDYYFDVVSVDMSFKKEDISERPVRRSTIFKIDDQAEDEDIEENAVIEEPKDLVETDLGLIFYLEHKIKSE